MLKNKMLLIGSPTKAQLTLNLYGSFDCVHIWEDDLGLPESEDSPNYQVLENGKPVDVEFEKVYRIGLLVFLNQGTEYASTTLMMYFCANLISSEGLEIVDANYGNWDMAWFKIRITEPNAQMTLDTYSGA